MHIGGSIWAKSRIENFFAADSILHSTQALKGLGTVRMTGRAVENGEFLPPLSDFTGNVVECRYSDPLLCRIEIPERR